MYNKIVLVGRLTKDVELSYTASGTAAAKFTLAVDRGFKSQDGVKEADFINIIAWKGLAENCAKFLAKGKLALVEGRLQIRNYEDKNGNKRTSCEVVANDVKFLSPKDGERAAAQAQQGVAPLDDDDLPF